MSSDRVATSPSRVAGWYLAVRKAANPSAAAKSTTIEMRTMEARLPKWAQTSAITPRRIPEPQASCMLRPEVPPVLVFGASSLRRLVRGARTRGWGGTGGANRVVGRVEGARDRDRLLRGIAVTVAP